MKSFRIQRKDVTGSTNDDATAAAEKGEEEGLVVWALKQRAGRGRHGRTWSSPEGNLYCSILLRPSIEAHRMGPYSLAAANAVYDTVRQCLPVANITLKWPNDILVEDEKIGGILLEVAGGALIIGVGLNVRHHPEGGLYPSTSLFSAGASPKPLDEILDMLLQNLRHWYELMEAEGAKPVRAAWLKHAATGPMTVRMPQGALEGEFAGLDDDGGLRLKLADGSERSIATGDVFLRP